MCIRDRLSHTKYKQICRTMIRDFDRLPITDEKKPRVGMVGEILVKFLPAANNHLAEKLRQELQLHPRMFRRDGEDICLAQPA